MDLKVLKEIFLDRSYNDNGTLVSRKEKNSFISDLEFIKNRIRNLKLGKIDTINRNLIDVDFDTICVHSDTPNSEKILKMVKDLI